MKNLGSHLLKLEQELLSRANPAKAKTLQRFFKTGQGEYGEGNVFIGIYVPEQRSIARKYYSCLSFSEIESLLKSPIHEFRLTVLLILVHRFHKVAEEQDKIFDFYTKNTAYINNWDLVDLSAPKICGAYLLDKDKKLLFDFSDSGDLWKQRIAIISTFHFIKNNEFDTTLSLAEKLLFHRHDLIHKAVGWMLREIGKRNEETELTFLKKHYKKMPRTMLRYAIEKFDPELRSKFLNGLF